MAFLAFLKSLFGATQAVSEEVKQRDAEKNSAPMQANAAAATDQAIEEKIESDMASGDLTKIQNDQADASQ